MCRQGAKHIYASDWHILSADALFLQKGIFFILACAVHTVQRGIDAERNRTTGQRILLPFGLLGDAVLEKLTANVYRQMAKAAAAQLEAEKARVNALNVFPVPDGDTGTNMSLTLGAAVDAVLASDSSVLGELAECAAQGALMGARGNSGVILSQFLRGFADGVAGLTEAGPIELANALVKAAEAAYGAVIKPVEGTVLTVGKEAAAEAVRLAQKGGDLLSVLEGAMIAAVDTLAHTPDLLATLREAGVVDAGGEGLVVAARGAFQVLNGSLQAEPVHEDAPKATFTPHATEQTIASVNTAVAPVTESPADAEAKTVGIIESDITYRYCTEFLVRGEKIDRAAMQRDLTDLGDSLLIVGQPNLVKVHVHTNHPGVALEICGVRGELLNIHINNMAEQNREAAHQEAPEDRPAALPAAAPPVAVVTVANGSGCQKLLASLGAAAVVEGGQTLNPSTEEILTAIKKTGAQSALVLPNNSNVLMTARQAAHLSSIPVSVVPTKSFCQGVAALLRFAPEESAAENARRMEAAIGEIACGEVTVAVRDAKVDAKEIKAGEYLGISGGKILTTGAQCNQVAAALITQLTTDDSSLVTLYYGEGVNADQANDLAAIIRKQMGVDVEVYDGGQPVYSYLLSVE